jgi:two-component system OmpR family response regulator
MNHILIVDDDPLMRELLTTYFADHGVRTSSAANRTEVNRHLSGKYPSLIILDLQLGQDDGLDILRSVRARSDVPIIIATGRRLDDNDRIIGLELGADDYLTKPFSLTELRARIRAVLRRHEMGRLSRVRESDRGGYRFEGWQLQRRGHRLVNPSGTWIPLTKREYALLLAFLGAPQRPLSRAYLLQATHVHDDIYDRSIDALVLRLRRKLEIDASATRVIETARGLGYMFNVPVDPF